MDADFDLGKFHLRVLIHDDHVDDSSVVQMRIEKRAPLLVQCSSLLHQFDPAIRCTRGTSTTTVIKGEKSGVGGWQKMTLVRFLVRFCKKNCSFRFGFGLTKLTAVSFFSVWFG